MSAAAIWRKASAKEGKRVGERRQQLGRVFDYLLGRTIRPLTEGQDDNARRPYIVAENNTGRMLRSDRYKYCVYTGGAIRESLVDLQTDSGEMKNLACLPEFCTTLNQHRGFLRQWIAESSDNKAKSFAIAPHDDGCEACGAAGSSAHPQQ